VELRQLKKIAEAQKWGWQKFNSYRLGCTENLASDKLCIQWLRPHYEQQSKLRYFFEVSKKEEC